MRVGTFFETHGVNNEKDKIGKAKENYLVGYGAIDVPAGLELHYTKTGENG